MFAIGKGDEGRMGLVNGYQLHVCGGWIVQTVAGGGWWWLVAGGMNIMGEGVAV